MKLDRSGVARALRGIATRLTLLGENPYRARAYERAARSLEQMGGDLEALIEEGRLTSIPGVGEAIASQIEALTRTGTTPIVERLEEKIPDAVIELADVPGVGVKRARAIHEQLGISTADELRRAAEEGRLRQVKGFGEKTERAVLTALVTRETRKDEVQYVRALALAERLIGYLRHGPGFLAAEPAGELRRNIEMPAAVDLVAAARDPEAMIEHVGRYPGALRWLARETASLELVDATHVRVRITVVGKRDYPTALFRLTGPESHVEAVTSLAGGRGLTLPRKVATEDDLYLEIGLTPVPPELRDQDGVLEEAATDGAFDDLITERDVRGLIHCHTEYSDGRDSVLSMARAAEAMGMKYITITDHSPTAHYAGGVTLDRLKQQWEEIDRASEEVSIEILRGTESDILADGSLDYPDAVLERFDVIVASIHNRHRMDRRAMTRRIVRAMRLPVFKIWGHALGRLLGRRPPFDVDIDAVLEAVASSHAAIEINGDPFRLDMPPLLVRDARKLGIPFVLSTDAHSTGELRNVRWATAMARRGGVQKSEVLNALSARGFARAVSPSSHRRVA
jgi:DNA polymerase (family X)